MFSRLFNLIRQAVRKIFGYKDIEQVERVETPLSSDMQNALTQWHMMYLDKADWLGGENQVKSLNLPALIASEIARQMVLEMKWSITGKEAGEDGEPASNPRAEYLSAEFGAAIRVLREKVEQGAAAGGVVVKPYPRNGHIYCDWAMDWDIYPLAFDDDGNMSDVIFPDRFVDGKTYYTRLERHQLGRTKNDNGAEEEIVTITQRAFKSENENTIGVEVPLESVPQWAELEQTVTIKAADGNLYGWYKVANANNVDVNSPMGASVYAKAKDTIEQADIQYSRLLWEYEGSELAVDVDITCLRPGTDGLPTIPRLNNRLFRGVDISNGQAGDFYNIFSPAIRDVSLNNGLNILKMQIEDQCGLARGTLSDANVDARTATELKIVKQRSYATIHDNQAALERCLRDVIRAMDKYASLYKLAPEGEYDVSFEWDDSILTDTEQENEEIRRDVDAGLLSKVEARMKKYKETRAQAEAAIAAINAEKKDEENAMLPDFTTITEPVA